ncbi:hypothetical protein BC830DRAFT_1158754 [Chytriomyces sp. MP71]|nr:hypothetical protein BC830DRAFT_1158754 [Chytriomyces sp. MP71]
MKIEPAFYTLLVTWTREVSSQDLPKMSALPQGRQTMMYYAASLSLLAFLSVPALLFIIRAHLQTLRIGLSLKSLLAPFNATLIGLGISIAALCANTSVTISADLDAQKRATASTVEAIWASSFHTCYVFCSYNRAVSIIHVYIPSMERVMNRLVILIPVILYLSVIPQAVSAVFVSNPSTSASPLLLTTLETLSRALNAAGSVLATIFDVILITAFTKVSRSLRAESGIMNDTQRFLIISKYGTWAVVAYWISGMAFIASTTFQVGFVPNALRLTAQTVLMMVYFILLAMKVCLQRERRQKPDSAKKVLEATKTERKIDGNGYS